MLSFIIAISLLCKGTLVCKLTLNYKEFSMEWILIIPASHFGQVKTVPKKCESRNFYIKFSYLFVQIEEGNLLKKTPFFSCCFYTCLASHDTRQVTPWLSRNRQIFQFLCKHLPLLCQLTFVSVHIEFNTIFFCHKTLTPEGCDLEYFMYSVMPREDHYSSPLFFRLFMTR